MWDWIKDKWELVASALVVLTVYVLGRKKQVAAEEMVEDIIEIKEKEAQAIKKIAGQERLQKALARQKYSESKLNLIKKRATAQSDLEKEMDVFKEISVEEKLRLAKAHQKYINSRIALKKQAKTAQSELERETVSRKLELIELAKEDPEEIDKILMEELNIAKLK